jgi:hypothetical protein
MTDRIVHLCNGDETADRLSLADLPGDLRVWADALDQGPLLPLDRQAFRARRAAFLAASRSASGAASTAGSGEPAVAAQLEAWERGLDFGAAEEVVLWYEHDLFDQLALCRILYLLATPELPAGANAAPASLFERGVAVTMVSIDRHPEVPQFLGLGQLAPEQLAQLWPRRTPISKDAVEEAIATWIAVTAADPRGLPFLMKRVRALPFLAGAIERHLEELPDLASGLGRSERQVLAAIGRGVAAEALMAESQAIDPRYPLTDLQLRAILTAFVAGGLVTTSTPAAERGAGAGPVGRWADLAVTALGRQALAGAVDLVAELGIDRWRGGVHLVGRGPVWRWDSASRRLLLR